MAGWIAEGVKDLRAYPWIPYTVLADWEVVGGVGFHGPPRDGTVAIGYGIVDSRQRRGIATAAVTQLIAKARVGGVGRVEATTAQDNGPSQRVLAACGFVRGDDRPSGDGPEQYWYLDL